MNAALQEILVGYIVLFICLCPSTRFSISNFVTKSSFFSKENSLGVSIYIRSTTPLSHRYLPSTPPGHNSDTRTPDPLANTHLSLASSHLYPALGHNADLDIQQIPRMVRVAPRGQGCQIQHHARFIRCCQSRYMPLARGGPNYDGEGREEKRRGTGV